MRPASSTVSRAHGARVLAAMLLPVTMGVVACSGGGGHASAGSTTARGGAGSATTASTDTGGTTTTAGADTGSATTVSDATTKWCTAFRSVDQNPASVDQMAMLSIVPPRDDLEFPWIFVVNRHDELHTPKQDDSLTQDYTQLKTFADTYCPR